MSEMTIRLECDPATGKKNLVVSLRSDADLLPIEHEELHRRLVEKLVGQGLVAAEEVGQLVIAREGGAADAGRRETPPAQRAAQAEGSR